MYDIDRHRLHELQDELIATTRLLYLVDHRENKRVIFMGTHGQGGVSRTFLGSMAKKVLRRTRKPVFIIPLPKEESDITSHDIYIIQTRTSK